MPHDSYLDPDTGIRRNLLGANTSDKLGNLERRLTSLTLWQGQVPPRGPAATFHINFHSARRVRQRQRTGPPQPQSEMTSSADVRLFALRTSCSRVGRASAGSSVVNPQLPGIRGRSVGVQPVLMKAVTELGILLGGHRLQQFERVGMSVVGAFYGSCLGSC
jgi:hypothetical protein